MLCLSTQTNTLPLAGPLPTGGCLCLSWQPLPNTCHNPQWVWWPAPPPGCGSVQMPLPAGVAARQSAQVQVFWVPQAGQMPGATPAAVPLMPQTLAYVVA